MLVTTEWSFPLKVKPLKDILLEYYLSDFSVRIYNAAGAEIQIPVDKRKSLTIESSKFTFIEAPMIAFKSNAGKELHVNFVQS